ncbi:urease accessory protein UreD [sulfur-oxidizing endosymbiont of Gigantopelta aegis]|uniref:urease accessory protein UreD n=1 Tax=sulfur-oxidizing endosymbiont of Gigantopelta aegis TaxID=2794934 RepID=UPI001BE45598|nr:urease accessory protein UreD [sulfur-oxidizing endosymbiont of Gigantopelta aegis]
MQNTVLSRQSMTAPPKKWLASLELVFTAKNNKTVLSKNLHFGPLMVQKPFYPESPQICHVYLLHPPGGVVHGDQLKIDARIQHSAHALITTPAAGKFYRSAGQFASLTQTLHVEKSAFLEWLPQETLLFNDSKVQLKTLITLAKGARFIGWEMLCLGRKASAEPYVSGECRQHFELWRDDKPLFIERCQIKGQSAMLKEQWGMASWTLTATLVATNCSRDQLKAVQGLFEQLSSAEDPIKGHISATLKEDVLICRFLGEQAEYARACFIQVWQLIRPAIMEQDAHIPRIWNT